MGKQFAVMLVGTFVLIGCGKNDNSGDIAKAFAGPPAPDSKKENEAKMKAMKDRAEAGAAKARADELERITTASSVLPELEAGCADAAAAHDEYKQKRLVGDPDELARWNATKEPDLRKVSESCTASGTPAVAACQANAWRNASIEHFTIDGEKELGEACLKRYGAPPAMQ
jgi:hypothetical protein